MSMNVITAAALLPQLSLSVGFWVMLPQHLHISDHLPRIRDCQHEQGVVSEAA
jgi:hypothetical protein